MQYNIIQPPFPLKFKELTKKQLKEYFKWYMEMIPIRIAELIRVVHESPGYESWNPDYSPESLNMLGEWYANHYETRKRTEEEIQEIKNKQKYPIGVDERELTNRTFSLAIDIGMYLSQVFLKNNPTLKWEQPLGSKNYVDYGQPVIAGFHIAGFNPTGAMIALAYGLAHKNRTGSRLRDIYDKDVLNIV